MKAVIVYQLTDKDRRDLMVEKESYIEKRQEFVFDTKDVEGTKEILEEIASVLVEDESPYFELRIHHSPLNELLTIENVRDILEKERDFVEKRKRLEKIEKDFRKLTGLRVWDYIDEKGDIDSIQNEAEELMKNYGELSEIGEKIQRMIDDAGYNFGDCCSSVQNGSIGEKFVERYLDKPEEARTILKRYVKRYHEVLQEREQVKEARIKDRIARGFSEEEAKKIAELSGKDRFEEEKLLWAEKFGSERLKEGLELGYNMNRIYHEERYEKEYGKGRLTDEWFPRASNPSLESLERLKRLKTRYPLDDVELVWDRLRGESMEIEADWAKKYWEIEVF